MIGALTFNFLFTQPYQSFRIEAEESVAAFAVYLWVARCWRWWSIGCGRRSGSPRGGAPTSRCCRS